MYKITNKANDLRKFRDSFLGKDILVEPKKFIFTNKPPKESEVWKVESVEKQETVEKTEKKNPIKSMEVKKMKDKKLENDSSSSR